MIYLNEIKNSILKLLPVNESGGNVTLSIGESMLLVIDACDKANLDEKILSRLKQLYLEGTKTKEETEFVHALETIFLDKNYTISASAQGISDDPIRRYFETHLAYRIIQNNAESLETAALEQFTHSLKQHLSSVLQKGNEKQKLVVEKILRGDMDEDVLNKYELEYAELTHKLLKQDYYGLSPKACDNLYQIACATILATLSTQHNKSMPLDVYSHSIFSMGMDGRGRIVKSDNNNVKTSVKGLMKSNSPMPLYNDLVNPVEEVYTKNELSLFQRSADQAGFMMESEWSQFLFSRQTQPYSNGISSTTLAQIRTIILHQRLGNQLGNNFKDYMTSFAALMLYNSGGHSFFEIFEVLKLPLAHELLSQSPDLLEAKEKDELMSKMLYRDQEHAFTGALKSTQHYARTLLNKKILNAQFTRNSEESSGFNSTPNAAASLHDAVLVCNTEALQTLLQDKTLKVDAPNHKKWSPLMVAAQQGKASHVKILLDAGANVNHLADAATALELAIKNQKFETVKVLLTAKAAIRKLKKPPNKNTYPALYLACRQSDMRILDAVLNYHKFTTEEYKKAISTALEIENLDALTLMVERVTPEQRHQYFTKEYQFSLFKQAVSLGNVGLINGLKKLGILPATEQLNYHELLCSAATKGYAPVFKYLLEQANKDPSNAQAALDFDAILVEALKNNQFNMVILSIIHGANPALIPTEPNALRAFNTYLTHPLEFEIKCDESEVQKIQKRAQHLNEYISQRTNSLLHRVIEKLIAFLNAILPTNARLGYNDKTDAMATLAKAFQHKSVSFFSRSEKSGKQEILGDKEVISDEIVCK